MPTNKTQ